MKPRKSTAILIGTWIAMFVLYMFVKPDHPVAASEPTPNTAPAVVNTAPPGH